MDGTGSARLAENAQTAFEDVTLTEADEEAADTWQDDGLQVDYVLRNGRWTACCAA